MDDAKGTELKGISISTRLLFFVPKKLLKIKDHGPGVAAAEPPTQILTRRSSNTVEFL